MVDGEDGGVAAKRDNLKRNCLACSTVNAHVQWVGAPNPYI